METRSLVLSLVVATAAFLLYMQLVQKFAPRATPPPAPVAESQPVLGAPLRPEEEPESTGEARPGSRPSLSAAPLQFTTGEGEQSITLGGVVGETAYPLRLELTPLGAGVRSIQLTTQNKKGRFVHRPTADSEAPYTLSAPLPDSDAASLQTSRLWIAELGNQEFDLAELVWPVVSTTPQRATFEAVLRKGEREDVLRIVKSISIREDQPLAVITYDFQNLGASPLSITFAQDAATGITHSDRMYDLRKAMVATRGTDGIELTWKDHNGLTDAPTLMPPARQFAWAATMDRYFGVYLRPLPPEGSESLYTDTVGAVSGLNLMPEGPHEPQAPSDMQIRLFSKAQKLEPGQRWQPSFEVYAGPKDADVLKHINPAYVQYDQLGYNLAQTADANCMCSFHWLTVLMTGLLRVIYSVVGNYGVAIIGLVIVVRLLLHPLAVFQQKSMYRMQESMGRLQPKMQAIKEKYANDKVKQNQEIMRMMGEEGVNPAGNFVAFIPMFIQMPILIALWQALSTDIELRLAPFDGWWIRDLSAPDAMIRFSSGITIPILSWLPLVGPWFTNIPSFNLLPFLMGIAMWLQQKYMPKPKIERPANAPPPKPGSMTPEEQQRQQQMIANMMAVMLPVMFYNFPSGLCLYWLATNIFGIFESLRIRKQIQRDKERRASQPVQVRSNNREPGLVGRWLRKMAEQAEEIQRRADQMSREKAGKKK